MDNEEDHLRAGLIGLNLPGDAVAWLCDMFNVIQVFDDVADADSIARPDLDRAIWFSLVGSATNQFYAKNAMSLIPVMSVAIMKWQASDASERAGNADARSYVWRAGFYDVVLLVCHLCRCPAPPETVLRLYGETFDEYSKEFGICQDQQ